MNNSEKAMKEYELMMKNYESMIKEQTLVEMKKAS